ncbi:MAG: hypothetical protein C4329_09085 [Chitinophagaceae bacterium]
MIIDNISLSTKNYCIHPLKHSIGLFKLITVSIAMTFITETEAMGKDRYKKTDPLLISLVLVFILFFIVVAFLFFTDRI